MDQKAKPRKRIPDSKDSMPFDDLGDAFIVIAKNIENSLLQAGAEVTDYTLLDLYKLAQPFVFEMFKREDSNIGFDITFGCMGK